MKKQLDSEIEVVKKERDEYKNKYLRALADYQNLEKRIAAARAEEIKHAAGKLIIQLLPVLDALEKTEEVLKDKGLAIVIKQFKDILSSESLKKIEVIGKKFDPHIMECIEVVESDKDEIVVEEVRSGYFLADKLLRPARVKVGKLKKS